MHKGIHRAGVVLLALVTVAGCASQVSGSAGRGSVSPSVAVTSSSSSEASSTSPSSSTVASPTKVPKPLPAVDEWVGRSLEAKRMGGFMPLPSALDTALEVGLSPSKAIVDVEDLSGGAKVSLAEPITQAGGLVAGFGSSRRNTESTVSLFLLVLQFETAEQAQAVSAADQRSEPGSSAVVLTGHPDAKVLKFGDAGTYVLEATRTEGTLLHYVMVATTGGDPSALVDKAFLELTESFADFVPTSATGRLALPADRDGIVSHTVGGSAEGRKGWYEPHGGLHYQLFPQRTGDLFERAGVDLWAQGDTVVVRAADASGARLVQADFISQVGGGDGWVEVSLTEMPADAQCLESLLVAAYYCVGVQDRYAFEVYSDSQSAMIEMSTLQQAWLALL